MGITNNTKDYMRLTIYKCDQCGEVLSDDKTHKSHLSLNFNRDSGLVEKTDFNMCGHKVYEFKTGIQGIHQFCDTKCLSKFINNLK